MTNSASPKATSSAPKSNTLASKIPINIPVKPDLLAIEIYDSLKQQMSSPVMKDRLFFLSKIGLVVSCYTFLVLNSLNNYVAPEVVPECIQDKMQDLTLPLNQHLAANPIHKSVLIIFASFMIDLNVFVLCMRWIIFGKNFKHFLIIFLFYLARAVMQSVFFLRYPTDYIWGHPGMFSVTVPYQPANDFFFSGHVGLCVICFVDFARDNVPFMKQFAFVSIFVEGFVLLVTRAHYFIDLVTGLVFAHYIYLVSDWIYAHYQKKNEEKAAKIKQVQKEAQLTKITKQKGEKPVLEKRSKKGSM